MLYKNVFNVFVFSPPTQHSFITVVLKKDSQFQRELQMLEVFLYDANISLVDFFLQVHLSFYPVLVLYHTVKINFEFLLIV